MDIDVLCVGHASYDLIFPVDHHPAADEKCFSLGLFQAGGGPAANAAVTVARLGGKAAFAGYLGLDIFGKLHFEELEAEGVFTGLVVRGDRPTPLSAILVKPDGKRTVVNHKAGTPSIEPQQLDFSRIRPKAILFDGHQLEISLPLAARAREQKIPAILDAGSVHHGTTELAPLCDYVIASEKFARDFSNGKSPMEAVRILAETVPAAAVTLGDAGLVWSAGGNAGTIPSFPVEPVDTTGAGDILHGAFALRMVKGDDFREALLYASAAAALGCTKMGARPGIPRREDVEEFLRRF